MIILLAIALLNFNSLTIENVVKEFHELASYNEELDFINKYESSAKPSILAYVIALKMKHIDNIYNPYKKLKIFKKNKKELNSLIKKSPNNIHLRYIRLLLQENTPSILSYNNYIEADKDFLELKENEGDEYDYLYVYIHKNTTL